MRESGRLLLSGNEAVALAARDGGVALGAGYPGTPSTEILERFAALGCRAQWSPNEKVALEVAIGAAFAGARALATMKHVGVNVAADPLFTVAYTGVTGALVVVSADDPGMASSQNEQDNRRYAVAAGIPMLEPSDSQEAYQFTLLAIQVSERWRVPVLLRLTTRVCHSKTVVRPMPEAAPPQRAPNFVRDVPGRVMIPAYARPAHRRLREKLASIAAWNEKEGPNVVDKPENGAGHALGIVASGVAAMHAREAAPDAAILKLGMTYPLPLAAIREFAAGVERCVVVEEGDPYLADALLAAGIPVEFAPAMYRFGELDVARVRRILARDETPEPPPPAGKPPELCQGCPYRVVFAALRDLHCIVAGDIGCYTLGVLPPFSAIDTCVCMGGSISVGLGMRHVLPPDQARRVVSVIGDSTFVHSGITGVVEMVYNAPPTGHVVLILDNGTTAMTGMQEHPGTGRSLEHKAAGKLVIEEMARAAGVRNVVVTDPAPDPAAFKKLVAESLERPEITVIVARRNCLLAAGKIKEYDRAINAAGALETCIE
jgi:indolepyruvate ferredoxin oxidoreductase, alpha subunit